MTNIDGPVFRSRRHIFRKREAERLVRQFAAALNWSVVAERPSNLQTMIARAVIWEIIPGLTVGYYDDPLPEASCVAVHSVRDPAEVHEFETIFKQNFDFLQDSDLFTALSESKPGESGHVLALVRLGFGAPQGFDRRYFDSISSAARDVRSSVRIAALNAIIYTEWPQFRPIVQQIVASDSDEAARNLASQIISAFDRMGLGEEP